MSMKSPCKTVNCVYLLHNSSEPLLVCWCKWLHFGRVQMRSDPPMTDSGLPQNLKTHTISMTV